MNNGETLVNLPTGSWRIRWSRRHFLVVQFVVVAMLLNSGACAASSGVHSLPNIVLILADDLGYGDVQAYNAQSKIPTPHIDDLAKQGIRLTDAHSAPSCIPSRYQLMTGRYLFRSHRTLEIDALIDLKRITVASVLKQAGYATAMIGKWHLGFEGLGVHPNPGNDSRVLRGGPVDHGFDTYFGIPASLDVAPYFYVENDHIESAPTARVEEHHTSGARAVQGAFWRGGGIAPGFRHEEVLPRLTERALQYVDGRGRMSQPFFLYFALPAPHAPWLPTEAFRGKSGAGAYGDYVMEVDAVVGHVNAALQKAGKTDNTLLIFASDNGPTWYPEDVHRFQHRAAGNWRGMKADAWEGGHRVPFIARWPGRITANATSDQLVSFTDFLQSFASLTAQKLPTGAGEDSLDVLPVLLLKATTPVRDTIVHEAEGPDGRLLAIRRGSWKLISSNCGVSVFEGVGFGPNEQWKNPCVKGTLIDAPRGQLYNLSADSGERKNVYSEHPGIVRGLRELLGTIREEAVHAD